ncbi:hypothetical protein L208DRAFT_1413236 [Tricholoma matsutake]|nr:hypothetical protein L208DRAFT_1413236 [Tricholoma matsutake 945]
MPQAPVDNKGTEMFYTDSGPVPGSTDYTTLVIYHGSAFTGHTFHKLLPFGAKDNIRLVIVNRREYAGSTKYTDDDLKDLNEGKVSFMEILAAEVAHLLVWFVETHNIPKASVDHNSGGLSIMGWSMGNTTSMSVFGYPEAVGQEAYVKLEPYLRQFILYDPPWLAFGYDQPPEGYVPFTDPDYPTQQAMFKHFGSWVSGYYNHPDIASRSIHGLNFDRSGELPNPNDPKSTGRNSSINNATAEEVENIFDIVAASRSELSMFYPMQPVIKTMAQRFLFDEKLVNEVLPKLDVAVMWCTRAQWYSVYGMIETERQYKENVKQGYKVRPIRFIELEGANHFVGLILSLHRSYCS